MASFAEQIVSHLNAKKAYTGEYVRRVEEYLGRNPDLAAEMASCLSGGGFPKKGISVKGYTARYLGARTKLSRSAAYVALARLREEDGSMPEIIDEESAYMRANGRDA